MVPLVLSALAGRPAHAVLLEIFVALVIRQYPVVGALYSFKAIICLKNFPPPFFWLLSASFIAAAIGVVAIPSVFYAAVSLGAALTVIAGLFVLFGADFLGIAQILVYVGGVMVIMLFVIMLSPQTRDRFNFEQLSLGKWLRGIGLALLTGGGLIKGFKVFADNHAGVRDALPTSASLGRLLLGDMLLPFEVISLILLVALVGAVLFGQDKVS